jgi:hypothetical protein
MPAASSLMKTPVSSRVQGVPSLQNVLFDQVAHLLIANCIGRCSSSKEDALSHFGEIYCGQHLVHHLFFMHTTWVANQEKSGKVGSPIRDELRGWARAEFERNRHVEDPTHIQYLISVRYDNNTSASKLILLQVWTKRISYNEQKHSPNNTNVFKAQTQMKLPLLWTNLT